MKTAKEFYEDWQDNRQDKRDIDSYMSFRDAFNLAEAYAQVKNHSDKKRWAKKITELTKAVTEANKEKKKHEKNWRERAKQADHHSSGIFW